MLTVSSGLNPHPEAFPGEFQQKENKNKALAYKP